MSMVEPPLFDFHIATYLLLSYGEY